jgi:hypothetical protein
MYEKPELTRVGDAQDVIQGIINGGGDLDGNWVAPIPPFEEETLWEE